MVWSINPYPCSIHGPSSLLAILYASLGWITLPRETWWNIFQTKSSDSRAPSLGALDRGRSWDLVSCHGERQTPLKEDGATVQSIHALNAKCKQAANCRSGHCCWTGSWLWSGTLHCAQCESRNQAHQAGPSWPAGRKPVKEYRSSQCIAVQATVEAFVFWSDTQVPQCWPSAIQG